MSVSVRNMSHLRDTSSGRSVCASLLKINLCSCEVVHKKCKQESVSPKEQAEVFKYFFRSIQIEYKIIPLKRVCWPETLYKQLQMIPPPTSSPEQNHPAITNLP